jgi:hypothetical protein
MSKTPLHCPSRLPLGAAPSCLLLSLALFLWAAGLAPLHAQFAVTLSLKRSLYLLHEPIIATVEVTNNTGRDVTLEDTAEAGPWFAFQIFNGENHNIPPRNPDYKLQPLDIHPAETVKRSVNLNELYMMDEYGEYRIKAAIYFAPLSRFFSTKTQAVELTEGSTVWKQTVGIPEAADGQGAYRTFTLLTMEHEKGKSLYVRIQGQDNGSTYGCYELGPNVAEFPPDKQFDRANNLWILQLVGQRTYFLSRVSADGQFLGQSTYVSQKSVPRLRKLPDGQLQIVGAYRQDREATRVAQQEAPKLSDRPAGLPPGPGR